MARKPRDKLERHFCEYHGTYVRYMLEGYLCGPRRSGTTESHVILTEEIGEEYLQLTRRRSLS